MYGSYIKKGVSPGPDQTGVPQSYKDEDFIPSALNIMKKDGKIYGVSFLHGVPDPLLQQGHL